GRPGAPRRRQGRRRDDDRCPRAAARRGLPERVRRGRGGELDAARRRVAGRQTAARRYAGAAFEVALRDGTVDDWRSELEGAAEALGDERGARMLSNPAIALEEREALVKKALS